MFTSAVLHKLIAEEEWDKVLRRIETHPAEVRKLKHCAVLDDGFLKSKALPLHHAVAKRAPRRVIRALLESHEGAVNFRETAYNRQVLHIACMNSNHSETIRLLVRLNPDACAYADTLFRRPIHYALANKCSRDTLELLLYERPETIQHQDHRGWLPFHVACAAQAPVDIIGMLLDRYPAALKAKDKDGRTALDLALEAPEPDSVVVTYLQRNHTIPTLIDVPSMDEETACGGGM